VNGRPQWAHIFVGRLAFFNIFVILDLYLKNIHKCKGLVSRDRIDRTASCVIFMYWKFGAIADCRGGIAHSGRRWFPGVFGWLISNRHAKPACHCGVAPA
jgi:hypothetical protein